MLIALLETARLSAAKDHHRSHEIEALRLLFVATDDPQYRAEYIDATLRFEQLLQHETELAAYTPVGWYELAERIHHYLHILVDQRLTNRTAAEAFARANVDLEAEMATRQNRAAAYEAADEEFSSGNHAACIEGLDAALPPVNTPWVFWDDLRALNQWIACSESTGRDTAQRGARIQQLRTFTARYVQQLTRTIENQSGQLLAIKLQHIVEEALRKSTRIPVAAESEAEPDATGILFDPQRIDDELRRLR